MLDDPICGNDILFRRPLPRPGVLNVALVPAGLPVATGGKLGVPGLAGGGVPGLPGQ